MKELSTNIHHPSEERNPQGGKPLGDIRQMATLAEEEQDEQSENINYEMLKAQAKEQDELFEKKREQAEALVNKLKEELKEELKTYINGEPME